VQLFDSQQLFNIQNKLKCIRNCDTYIWFDEIMWPLVDLMAWRWEAIRTTTPYFSSYGIRSWTMPESRGIV